MPREYGLNAETGTVRTCDGKPLALKIVGRSEKGGLRWQTNANPYQFAKFLRECRRRQQGAETRATDAAAIKARMKRQLAKRVEQMRQRTDAPARDFSRQFAKAKHGRGNVLSDSAGWRIY